MDFTQTSWGPVKLFPIFPLDMPVLIIYDLMLYTVYTTVSCTHVLFISFRYIIRFGIYNCVTITAMGKGANIKR